MDTYSVNCAECEDRHEATYIGRGLWVCNNCRTSYDEESGQIVNETTANYYRSLFNGAKIAGIIPEREWFRKGDKEQMRHERW